MIDIMPRLNITIDIMIYNRAIHCKRNTDNTKRLLAIALFVVP